MKTWLRTLIVLGCLTEAGGAAASGVNLSWDDCGPRGTRSKAFACDTDAGTPFVIIGSFVPPPGISEFVGLSAELGVNNGSDAVLSDWWSHSSGRCRGSGAFSTNFDFTSGPFGCADFFGGQGYGGFVYEVGYGGPSTARIRIQCAVMLDSRGALDPSLEYFAFKLQLGRSKSAGASACSGCAKEACVQLRQIQLYEPDESRTWILTNPADRAEVSWQDANAGCLRAAPARNETWGRVKLRYR